MLSSTVLFSFSDSDSAMTTHEKLLALLEQHQARYQLMSHEPTGKCEAVAAIRGTQIGQGAKALVGPVKGNGVKQHVLAVLPADQQADLARVAEAVGGRRASLASPAEVDPLLFERFSEIAFNAGRLDRSVILNTEDYRRLSNANVVKIIQ